MMAHDDQNISAEKVFENLTRVGRWPNGTLSSPCIDCAKESSKHERQRWKTVLSNMFEVYTGDYDGHRWPMRSHVTSEYDNFIQRLRKTGQTRNAEVELPKPQALKKQKIVVEETNKWLEMVRTWASATKSKEELHGILQDGLNNATKEEFTQLLDTLKAFADVLLDTLTLPQRPNLWGLATSRQENCELLARCVLVPEIMALETSAKRELSSLLSEIAKLQPKLSVDAIIVPIMRMDMNIDVGSMKLNVFQCSLLRDLIKMVKLPNDVLDHLFGSCYQELSITPASITILQHVINNEKPHVNNVEMWVKLLQLLNTYATQLKNSPTENSKSNKDELTKLSRLMFSLVSKLGSQFDRTSHLSIISNILDDLQARMAKQAQQKLKQLLVSFRELAMGHRLRRLNVVALQQLGNAKAWFRRVDQGLDRDNLGLQTLQNWSRPSATDWKGDVPRNLDMGDPVHHAIGTRC